MRKNSLFIGVGILIICLVAAVFLLPTLHAPQGTDIWQEQRGEILPQLMPSGNKELLDLVWEPLSNEVDIGVVLDGETQYHFITEEMLTAYGITKELLYSTALDNLEDLVKQTEIEVASASNDTSKPENKYVIVETGDSYSAVRLLSTSIRKAVARQLGKEYIGAIPTRDFLIFWHKDFPLTDAFLQQVQQEYSAEQIYRLSPQPFLVSKSTIDALQKVENAQ